MTLADELQAMREKDTRDNDELFVHARIAELEAENAALKAAMEQPKLNLFCRVKDLRRELYAATGEKERIVGLMNDLVIAAQAMGTQMTRLYDRTDGEGWTNRLHDVSLALDTQITRVLNRNNND